MSGGAARRPGPENAEWRLAAVVDAISAEIDRAHDTLSLKSYGRGLTLGLRGLNLDLAVEVRVDASGHVYFRSVEDGRASASVLKLSFEQVVESQLEEVRKPLDGGLANWPLSTLENLSAKDAAALQALGIFSVDDLHRYTRTTALFAELSRQSGIAESRLRGWAGAPFLVRVEPPSGTPGEGARIEGGNLGTDPGEGVFFQDVRAEILAWSATRIDLQVPAQASAGPVYAVIAGAATNALPWAPAEPAGTSAASRRRVRRGQAPSA
jgi:peptide/nickel transport system substrate-binding protein